MTKKTATPNELHVNDDGSVPMEQLKEFYDQVWEPDFVNVARIRQILHDGDNSSNRSSNRSVMMGQLITMLKKLRPGTEMHRMQSPMFAQRPKSVLDTISDYYSPRPEMLRMYREKDPVTRMLAVFQRCVQSLALAQTKGLDYGNPYNPVLRERFRCKWQHETSTTHYIAEQVSHHPAISAIFMWNEKAHFYAWETKGTTPVFRGNSLEFPMRGEHHVVIYVQNDKKPDQFEKEEYVIRLPGLSLAGLLFGNARMEVASHSFEITCGDTDLKLKGKFKSGNGFTGKMYRGGNRKIRSLKGSLEGKCDIINLEQHPNSSDWDNHAVTFMDNTAIVEHIHMKTVSPIEEMHPLESRRVWFAPNYAIRKLKNLEVAGKFKAKIEEHQRYLRKQTDFTTEPELFKSTGEKMDNVPIFKYKLFDQTDRLCSGQILVDNDDLD